jgi:hypothetical protein
MLSPIGGYFGMEFKRMQPDFPHKEGVLLNSGRHALEYILLNLGKVDTVYLPFFTCEVVMEPIKRLKLKVAYYHINENLEIKDNINLGPHDYIVYVNYFGLKDKYVASLYLMYRDKLIIDNAQAFYAIPFSGCHQFYSPRKFVGCPDGGVAVLRNDDERPILKEGKSYQRSAALLMRADGEVALGYSYFKSADESISDEEMTQMSRLTKSILSNVDYEQIVEVRRSNFRYLNQMLGDKNRMGALVSQDILSNIACPMVYPYWTDDITLRQKLIDNKVFVAKYWPNVLAWCQPADLEYQLTEQIIPLPIDQRYGQEEMDYILRLI